MQLIFVGLFGGEMFANYRRFIEGLLSVQLALETLFYFGRILGKTSWPLNPIPELTLTR